MHISGYPWFPNPNCSVLILLHFSINFPLLSIQSHLLSVPTNRPRNSKVSLLLVWCSVPLTVAARSHSGKAEQIHEHLPARYYPRFSWRCISCVLQHCETLTWMQDAKLISLWTVPHIDLWVVLKIISFVYSCQNRKKKANQTKTMAKTTITTKHTQIIQ